MLLGPLHPPYMGPSIATEIILQSSLKGHFNLYHLNTNIHKTLSTLGKWRLSSLWKNIVLYLKMINLIIKYKPDLVLIPISQTTSGFIKDSIYILISRLFLRKTLLQLRGGNFRNWLDSSTMLTRAYVSAVIRSAQGVIVLGNKLRQLFSDYFKEEQIFVVPNGANYNFPFNQKRNSYKIKVLYLGNLQLSKGIEDVVEAFVLLKRDSTDLKYEVDIVGNWRDEVTKDKCSKLINDRDLPITFYPSVGGNDRFSFFKNADIFIFPPREPEGHPWVIVEAMAAGLPIISTDQGAITESVIDGVNGFIVEKQNSQQIAEKIKILIEVPELRKKMGKESRRLYEENFTEEKMVERLTQAFNSVLNQNLTPTRYK